MTRACCVLTHLQLTLFLLCDLGEQFGLLPSERFNQRVTLSDQTCLKFNAVLLLHTYTPYTQSELCPTKHYIQYIYIILFLITLIRSFCNIVTPFEKKSAKVVVIKYKV